MDTTIDIQAVRDRQYERILDVARAGPRPRACALAREHLSDFPDDEAVRTVLERLEAA